MTPQEILDKPLSELTKEEQTRISNMAICFQQHMNGEAYIPLQDLPKFEAAYKRLYGKAVLDRERKTRL